MRGKGGGKRVGRGKIQVRGGGGVSKENDVTLHDRTQKKLKSEQLYTQHNRVCKVICWNICKL